ncbi:MAG: metal ABC transporter substrate-binding protein [Bacilli bacterium]
MKKKLLVTILILVTLITTGCFKRDEMENINIITTIYPLEYITNYLYGKNSTVRSIYPDAVDVNIYKFNDKQITDFSKNDLFIYKSVDNDKDIAIKLLKKNKNILLIDATYGMVTELGTGGSDLWLNPSHLLMISSNIKNGLKEYINNKYLKEEIEDNYQKLKIEISVLDANIILAINNATNKTILVNDDSLLFLEKYGLKVISLDARNNNVSDKLINDIKEMIDNKEIKYLYSLNNKKLNNYSTSIIEDTKIENIIINDLTSITDEERDNKENYITLITKNIELLKKQLYD